MTSRSHGRNDSRSPRARRRRRVLIALGFAVVVLGGIGGAAAFRLGKAASDLRDARDVLDEVGVAIEDGRLADARRGLDTAQTLVGGANSRLYGAPELDLVGWLPVVHQNLESLRGSVGIALRLTEGGGRILDAAAPLADHAGHLEVPLASGALPLPTISLVEREVTSLADELATVDESQGQRFVIGPLSDLRERVVGEAARRGAQLDDVGRALSMIADMAGDTAPRRYLIAVANTAEMRGAGGMILSYGELLSSAGDFELGAFGRIDELQLGAPLLPEQVELPDDYLRRWSGFDVTQRWRNATMAADFSLVAPNLLRMYEAATGSQADGVIQIDPEGLAAILAGVGPVDVPGLGQVTAENVVAFTLNEAYFRFPGVDQRSDVLGDIAEAVFTRLVEGDYPSLRPLGEALVQTVRGRHLLAYARNDTTEGHYRWFGVDGELPATEHVHLTVQNLSGNKLDFYVDSKLSLRGSRPAGGLGTVTAEIELRNNAPAGAVDPPYIFGPFSSNAGVQVAGQYRSVVSLYVPSGTELTSFTGDVVSEPVVQTEGGRAVVSYTVDVLAGAAPVVTLELTLPPRPAGRYALYLTPAPRVRATTVVIDMDTGDGAVHAELVLDRGWRLEAGARPAQVLARDIPRDLDRGG